MGMEISKAKCFRQFEGAGYVTTWIVAVMPNRLCRK
jgi:hypothetical protein